MIKGVGIDIIEVERIKKTLDKKSKKFLCKVFTELEIASCQKKKKPEIFFAGRFAAKEAVIKALGSLLKQKPGWKEIEIVTGFKGLPEVKLTGRLNQKLKKSAILISISHTDDLAIALAILCD